MIVVDVNLLIYAYNPAAAQNLQARRWLEAALSGDEAVGLPWIVLIAFLRLTTSTRIFPSPLKPMEAADVVERWLTTPSVTIPIPSERHWSLFRELLAKARVRGPEMTDAHLAALTIEHGATLCTSDRDFARFPGLKLLDPLQT